MVRGAVTGIAGEALVGWIEAGGEGVVLEAAANGEAPFARTRPLPGPGGRLVFAIPLPETFRDRTIRFIDVRAAGQAAPLAGGPVLHDGGLTRPGPAFARAMQTIAAERAWARLPADGAGAAAHGAVEIAGPDTVSGWAEIPGAPERAVRVEILADERLVASLPADQPREDGARTGFSIDLSRQLRRGPHAITVRAEGGVEPLEGGRFTLGPFPADGEVALAGYLDEPAERALLERLPFEQQARDTLRMAADRTLPRLINRLRRERIVLSARADGPAMLLDLDGDEALAATWTLQSHPNTAYRAVKGRVEAIKAAAQGADYVFLGRAGDLIHPSAAGIAALSGGADVIFWSRFCADQARAGSPGIVLRRPRFDMVSFRHGAVSDTTFAVRGAVLSACPGVVLRALIKGRVHPLIFWLAGQDLRWHAHAEALTSSVGPPPASPPREQALLDEALCRAVLAEEAAPFTLERTSDDAGPHPLVLTPVRRARKTSVVVCFRDQARLTLRCVHALARQQPSGELELVLVDNQSEPAQARWVLDAARAVLGAERVRLVAYDAPFNHSAQNNLGARAATGEVIVICNNDVALQSPDALEHMAAWALQPGVGAVGCRLENPGRGDGSYGHSFAPSTDDPFAPLLREDPDPTYARHVHACAGATMALAAVSRERFLSLGGLDEARFPVGYNDMEFMLRASAAGLTHLYLGHLEARHDRGASRTGDDEDLQALLVNQMYGDQAVGRMFQLAVERVSGQADGPLAAQAAQAAARAEVMAEKAAVKGEIDTLTRARRDIERGRAKMAATLARASELAAQLGRGQISRARAAELLAELNRELAARALEG